MMPRPGCRFPIDVALADSDRQAISNGITTVFPTAAMTRSVGPAQPTMRENFSTRSSRCGRSLPQTPAFHLRHETYNLDGGS